MTKKELKILIKECIKEIYYHPTKKTVYIAGKSITITLTPTKIGSYNRWIASNNVFPQPPILIPQPTPEKAFLKQYEELKHRLLK